MSSTKGRRTFASRVFATIVPRMTGAWVKRVRRTILHTRFSVVFDSLRGLPCQASRLATVSERARFFRLLGTKGTEMVVGRNEHALGKITTTCKRSHACGNPLCMLYGWTRTVPTNTFCSPFPSENTRTQCQTFKTWQSQSGFQRARTSQRPSKTNRL